MPAMRWSLGALVLAGLLVLPAFPTAAAEGDQSERPDLTAISLEELAQTKVTSVSRTDGQVFRTPAAIDVVTAEDIRRSGATSLAEVLRTARGVHVARIHANQWAIGIRGFTSRLTRSQLAIMDGRSLYTPLFAGTYWEVQDTLLEDVERIEIVRGPGGTLWGANAVNGIVSIVTKDAQDTQGGFLSVGAGSEERAFVQARYGDTIGQRGHYRVYGRYFNRDAAFHASGNDFDDWHLTRGGFRTDWELGAKDRLTVQGDLYFGRAGQRASLTFYEPPFVRISEQEAELSGGNLNSRWRHSWQGSEITAQAYYDRTRRQEANFQEVRDTFDLDLQHRFGLANRHQVVWGLGYRISSGRGQGIETVAFVPSNRTDHIVTAFVHDEVDLVKDRLRLGVGAKLERNQYTGFEVQPSARALWSPHARHAVWAAASRAVRTPSRLERDLALTASLNPSAPLFARVSGNEAFTSEKTFAYEAGYRVRPADRLSLSLALFHNRYHDLASLETGPPFAEDGRQIVPFRFANGVRGRSSGLELGAVGRVSTRWQVTASYSHLDLDLETEPGSTDTTSAAAAGASPRHAARIQSWWMLPADLDLVLAWRWVDELPSQRVPAYSELDARLGWLVGPDLELAVVGENLLHDHHAEFGAPATRTEIQRSVYGEVRWRW